MTEEDIGEALVRREIISREQLNIAREVVRKTGEPVEMVLVELGFARKEQVLALKQQA